jgi:hypothetical protein
VRTCVQMSRWMSLDHEHTVLDLSHRCLLLQRRSRLSCQPTNRASVLSRRG